MRYIFGRPGLMDAILACQKLDADLSSALFPVDAFDPVLLINSKKVSKVKHADNSITVPNLSTSLRIRSDICTLWYVKLT